MSIGMQVAGCRLSSPVDVENCSFGSIRLSALLLSKGLYDPLNYLSLD